jgi:hypothetical protein
VGQGDVKQGLEFVEFFEGLTHRANVRQADPGHRR